jgi:hypothetical protein
MKYGDYGVSSLGELRSIIGNVSRLAPMFLVLSVCAVCCAKYLLKVPSDQVALVATVPLVSLLAVNRIIIFLLPGDQPNRNKRDARIPASYYLFGAGFVIGTIFSCTALLSSLFFFWLGFLDISHVGIIIGVRLLVFSTFAAVLMVATIAIQALVPAFKIYGKALVHLTWTILIIPNRIGHRIFDGTIHLARATSGMLN